MSAVKSALLLLALAAALPASAAAAAPDKTQADGREALRCDDGRAPVMTGNPFRPFSCPPGGKEPPRADVAFSTANAPVGSKRGDLDALEGRWRGLCYFGVTRYQCELTVSDGGRRAVWLALDYHTLLGDELDAELVKPGWFSRGGPKLIVTMPHLPGARLTGRVWLAPGTAACKFDGRPEVQRVDYKVEGDKLQVTYTDFTPDHGAVAASFTLDRVR